MDGLGAVTNIVHVWGRGGQMGDLGLPGPSPRSREVGRLWVLEGLESRVCGLSYSICCKRSEQQWLWQWKHICKPTGLVLGFPGVQSHSCKNEKEPGLSWGHSSPPRNPSLQSKPLLSSLVLSWCGHHSCFVKLTELWPNWAFFCHFPRQIFFFSLSLIDSLPH